MADNFAKLPFWQTCFRRFAEISTSPVFYSLLTAFVFVGAIIGPYGMREQLGFFERLAFSLQTNLVLWPIGIAVAVPIRIAVFRLHPNRMMSLIIGCLCAGLAITPVLYFLLRAQIDAGFALGDYFEYSVLFFVLASIITFITVKISRESAGGPLPDQPQTTVVMKAESATKSELMNRLAPGKRGRVLALIAQDHYVEVITRRGAELILMRLSDAIAEVGAEPGMRVHRSAWVAFDAIESIGREQRRSFALLINGRKVPVARASAAVLSKALTKSAPATVEITDVKLGVD